MVKTKSQTSSDAILVDGHVHFQRGFNLKTFLEAAARGFAAARRERDLPESTPGCLFLTETAEEAAFARLADGVAASPAIGWRSEPSGEAISFWLESEAIPAPILVVAGRQVATAEGLEVLAVGYRGSLEDGLPAAKAIGKAADAGALPILPWGFGKWTGKRRRIVSRLIQESSLPSFFLGDNGGRPRGLPRPMLFRLGEKRGRFVLPGSDPLLLSSHERRPGSFGFVFPGSMPQDRPFESVQTHLRSLKKSPQPFGAPNSLARAIASQAALRLARKPA